MRRLLLVLATFSLAACAGRSPAPSSAPSVRTPLVRNALDAPWQVRDAGLHRAQRISVRSHLISRVDSVVREDSLESRLDVAWSEVPDASPRRVAGMVTRFEVRVLPDTTGVVPSGVTLPFSFVAELATGAIPAVTTPPSASCDQPNAAVIQGWREAWVSLPARLEPGQRWQDSSRYVFCRDGIPLTAEVVRAFTAVEAEDRGGEVVVVVDRETRQTLRGEGTQFGEPVTLRGEGDGTMRLWVALRRGVIVDAEGTSTLRVELEGRRRRQELVQTSLVQIAAPE